MEENKLLEMLNTNPHCLIMAVILAQKPALLTRLENGDYSVLKKLSELAQDHFMGLLVQVNDPNSSIGRRIRECLSRQVYNRLRNTDAR